MLNQVFQTLPKFKSGHHDKECSDKEPFNKAEDVGESSWRFVARHPVPSKQRTSFNFFVQRATGNKNVSALDFRCQGRLSVFVEDFVRKTVCLCGLDHDLVSNGMLRVRGQHAHQYLVGHDVHAVLGQRLNS
jgi:hypothetical protein